ncbi:MAG: peptidoglycan editing factor PgeF [Deltaproteobacteria bacterium]|nr:peptidoglycan editing factor PgeF [Candidatus Anaeroferrophillacea bacterium]
MPESCRPQTIPVPRRPWTLDRRRALPYIGVDDAASLLVAFSGRHGGVSRGPCGGANMAWQVGDDDRAVAANRRLLLEEVAGSGRPPRLITVTQVHGDRVMTVESRRGCDPGVWRHLEADGLITREPGPCLGILTADCFPVLLAAGENAGVGAVHAGWRGVVRGIVPRAIEKLAVLAGVRPAAMRMFIGPGIRRCCFEVGEEVPAALERACPALDVATIWWPGPRPGYGYLDLPAAICRQAQGAGVQVEHIADCGLCTADGDFFFSYRRDHGITGRQIGVIGLRAG